MAHTHATNDFECELTTPETEVIPEGYTEDGALSVHNTSYGFCSVDPSCPCHRDPDLINAVNEDYQAGLITGSEAFDIRQGRTL